MSRWVAVVSTYALLALAACGGGGGGSAVEPVEDVARIQPGDRPVQFRLDTDVSQDIQRFIVETLGWVHADLGDSGPLTIHVYSDEEHFVTAYTRDIGIAAAEARRRLAAGQTAFAGPGGHIWIYLTNFQRRTEGARRVALFHEYTHELQFWQAEIRFQSRAPDDRSFVPRWMVEGCAEYLAIKAGARRGFANQRAARATVVARVKQSADPLEVFETEGKASYLGGEGEAYTVGWLGCEQLDLRGNEDAVAHRFWLSLNKLRDWRSAFAETFGLTVDAFYAEFATFRATL